MSDLEEIMSMEERRKLGLPDRRKQTYASLEKLIDDHAEYLDAKLSRWIKLGLLAFSIIAMFCILGLVGYGVVLREIQNQRHEACQGQNVRHDRTVVLFKKEAADLVKKHPEQANAVAENTAANLRIIDSLTPKQDCNKLAPRGWDIIP